MTTRNPRVRFCGNNMAAASGSVVTGSSALTAYPVANAAKPQRFRQWRPSGRFTIGSTNDLLYINDGSNKTITLTSADYTTPVLLAAHIQTQLNASSSNWTCSYSMTTFKFTIGRSSGTAILRFTQTSNAAWDTLGYTTSSDTATSTGLAANEIRIHTSETYTVDLGAAFNVQFIALIGAPASSLSFSSSAAVSIAGNASNAWTSPTLSVAMAIGLGGIFYHMDAQSASSTFRYWRVTIQDRTNPLGPNGLVIAHLYIGDAETVTSRNVGSGIVKQTVDPSAELVSESGARYYQTFTKYTRFTGCKMEYLVASERRLLEQLFFDLGRSTPFYICFDPTLLVSTDLSELTRYVTFDADPQWTHVKSDVYSASFDVKESI